MPARPRRGGGYGLVALSWLFPSLYRPWGCPRVPKIPSYDLGKILKRFWGEIPLFPTFLATIRWELYDRNYCSRCIVGHQTFGTPQCFGRHFFIRTPFWV